jgi:aromatic amino acid aminotransferase I
MFDPTVRSLAGGLPNPGFFPFETLSSMTLSPTTYAPGGVTPKEASWLEKVFGKHLTQIEVPKYGKTKAELQLSSGLQYGGAAGFPALTAFLREWTTTIVPPAYSNWEVLLCDGSTDAFHKSASVSRLIPRSSGISCRLTPPLRPPLRTLSRARAVVELLCERGDGILCESMTYPSALETGWPMGVRPVPVTIDDLGLVPEALEETLANWDPSARNGMKRPTVLYTIPIG